MKYMPNMAWSTWYSVPQTDVDDRLEHVRRDARGAFYGPLDHPNFSSMQRLEDRFHAGPEEVSGNVFLALPDWINPDRIMEACARALPTTV